MNFTRDWTTPVTMGAFVLMAVTGVLMFFHLDSGLNKEAHEWLSWVFLGGVGMHVYTNRAGFKRHFTVGRKGLAIVAAGALLTVASFWSPADEKAGGLPPSAMVMQVVTQAPLLEVAGLAGKSVDQVVAELQQAGFQAASAQSSLASIVGDDPRVQGEAVSLIFSGTQG